MNANNITPLGKLKGLCYDGQPVILHAFIKGADVTACAIKEDGAEVTLKKLSLSQALINDSSDTADLPPLYAKKGACKEGYSFLFGIPNLTTEDGTKLKVALMQNKRSEGAAFLVFKSKDYCPIIDLVATAIEPSELPPLPE